MKFQTIIILFLFLFSSISSSQKKNDYQLLQGNYQGGTLGTLTLKEDSTFLSHDWSDCSEGIMYIYGKYSVSHDTLELLKIDSVSYNDEDPDSTRYSVIKDSMLVEDLLPKFLNKIIYHDKKLYLLPIDNNMTINPYTLLCDIINGGELGRAPMGGTSCEYRTCSNVIGLKKFALPSQWHSFILKKPLDCKIIDPSYFVVDKGFKDGLRVGMTLNSYSYTVVSTTKHTALLKPLHTNLQYPIIGKIIHTQSSLIYGDKIKW